MTLKKIFGQNIRHYRLKSIDPLKSKALTQERLGEMIYEFDDKLIYTKTHVTNWENGKRKVSWENRDLLAAFIYVFFKCGALTTFVDANNLLISGGYAPLNECELERIGLNLKSEIASLIQSAVVADNAHDEIPSAKIAAFQSDVQHTQYLFNTLAKVEDKRFEAILNLSNTQRQVLIVIPFEPTNVENLIVLLKAKTPNLKNSTLKEIHLRLHELRYLGLIDRKKDKSSKWFYWRTPPKTLFSNK